MPLDYLFQHYTAHHAHSHVSDSTAFPSRQLSHRHYMPRSPHHIPHIHYNPSTFLDTTDPSVSANVGTIFQKIYRISCIRVSNHANQLFTFRNTFRFCWNYTGGQQGVANTAALQSGVTKSLQSESDNAPTSWTNHNVFLNLWVTTKYRMQIWCFTKIQYIFVD